MAQLHLVIGPVGAGKSTFASRLRQEHGALRLTLDDWMTRLFRPDRPKQGVLPWYVERARRCVDQIWQVSLDALAVDMDVVLEIGLILRVEREDFYARVDAAEVGLRVYLVDAPREIRRKRVEQRNRERGETFSVEVPPAFFELASDRWEPPDDHEHAMRKIVVLATG